MRLLALLLELGLVLLGLILLLGVIQAVLGVFEAIERLLAALGRLLLNLAVATVPALVASAAAQAWSAADPSLDADATALLAGGATMAASLLLLMRRRHRAEDMRGARPGTSTPRPMPPQTPNPPPVEPPPPDLPAAFAESFIRAIVLAPAHAAELARARLIVARLLARAAGTLDPAVHDVVATIGNALPKIMEQTEALCEDAEPAERDEHIDTLMEMMRALVASAEGELARDRNDKRQARDTLRAHIRQRTGR